MAIKEVIQNKILPLRLEKANVLVVHDPDHLYRKICNDLADDEHIVVDATETRSRDPHGQRLDGQNWAGLDFYQRPDNWNCIGVNDFTLRKCLETGVDIFRSKSP